MSGSVCAGHGSHRPVLLHEGLSLPVPRLPLRHWSIWADLPAPVPPLLLPRLHQGQEASQSAPERKLPSQEIRVIFPLAT